MQIQRPGRPRLPKQTIKVIETTVLQEQRRCGRSGPAPVGAASGTPPGWHVDGEEDKEKNCPERCIAHTFSRSQRQYAPYRRRRRRSSCRPTTPRAPAARRCRRGGQRVPIRERPVFARCPVCCTEFEYIAISGGARELAQATVGWRARLAQIGPSAASPPPTRHWRSYGTDPLPRRPRRWTGRCRAFPSWFLSHLRPLRQGAIRRSWTGLTGVDGVHSQPVRRMCSGPGRCCQALGESSSTPLPSPWSPA